MPTLPNYSVSTGAPSTDLRERQRIAAEAADARRAAADEERLFKQSGLTREQWDVNEAVQSTTGVGAPVSVPWQSLMGLGLMTPAQERTGATLMATPTVQQGANGLGAGQIAPVAQQAAGTSMISGGSFSPARRSVAVAPQAASTLPPQAASNLGTAAPAPLASPFGLKKKQKDVSYFGLPKYG